MNPIEIVKAHPVVTGVSVVAVLAVGFFVVAGGGGSQAATTQPTVGIIGQSGGNAGANDAIQAGVVMQQIQAQTANAEADRQASLQALQIKSANDITLATIAQQVAFNANDTNKTITLAKNASDETISTLTINAQKDISLGNINSATTLAQLANAKSAAHDAAALKLANIQRKKDGLWQIIFGE